VEKVVEKGLYIIYIVYGLIFYIITIYIWISFLNLGSS
jgi:hypothetical protein